MDHGIFAPRYRKSTGIIFNNCIILVSGKDDSPYYTYLGAAPNLDSLRNLLEDR